LDELVFGIGTVARLGGVSVRTLRYYDEIGLLRPVWVDPNTGYRWYQPEQLHRLHRIVALRDLGVRLVEIGRLLDESLSVEELRGILLLRRAEAHDRLAAEAERLGRVAARLVQMEEPTMTDYDVVVKSSDPEWVVAITEKVDSLAEIGAAHGRLWPRLHAMLEDLGVERVPPSIATERGTAPIEFTAALPVPDNIRYQGNGAETIELPGLPRAATTVIHGDPDFDGGFRALRAWIDQAGEEEAGELREIYLDCDGPRDTWVVELQLALEPPSPTIQRRAAAATAEAPGPRR
jgi:DNA-binding transcriptional MerR regulator